MGEQEDICDRLSGSQIEGEMEEQEEGDGKMQSAPLTFSHFSSSVRAMIRIKLKYQAIKRRRLEMMVGPGNGGMGLVQTGAASRTSPKIFTFDSLTPSTMSSPSYNSYQKKRKKIRRSRVMFPSGGDCRAPPKQEQSRAKNCLLLLLAIVFLQVYNAIENLDDHVLRYDLEGLEKTLRREVFSQQGAVEALLSHLKDYLSTYVHSKPLVLSLHGPSGVGKSHIGRLLAGHFRSVVGESLVLQYYVLHHCPLETEAWYCARALSTLVTEMVTRAEEDEKIPVFIFDEVEHMHGEILGTLRDLVISQHSNEYLNAVYLFLSNLGHGHITKHLLHNSSSGSITNSAVGCHNNLVKELSLILHNTLENIHPIWAEAELLPLILLEKSHVMECFMDEMSREGFYPDRTNIERLAGEMEYYPSVGGRKYARTGCKQVVAKVNML
ncbi:torsin-4A [Hypomesus transpacificus]|uniref:torsin-4A n=1 Tax=Hypomesus transpacificus TaxID=137520 RepID=UPI001F079B63|nr:torsin-4A [Hypomesus transpacificus]